MKIFPHKYSQEDQDTEDEDILKSLVEEAINTNISNEFLYMPMQYPRPGLLRLITSTIRSNDLPIEYSNIIEDGEMTGVIYRILKSNAHLLPELGEYRCLNVPGRAAMYFHELPGYMFPDESKAKVAKFEWRKP